MEFIHVRSLERYHPGYKDRSLSWAKIHCSMVQGDPDVELICEVDWGRLIKFILLELEAKRPLPVDNVYFTRKGFDLKRRPIALTIQMLHNFIDVVTEGGESANPVTEEKKLCNVEKSRVEKSRVDVDGVPPTLTQVQDYCKERKNPIDPNRFIDFYSARGWMLNKVRMKDWRAAVRTWEKNGFVSKASTEQDSFKTYLSQIESDYASGIITIEEKNKKISEWKK